ncbi:haloacid dehalogenase type II [Spongiivirga citrea]|uniref:Haloacid dehalogenase type II n=1 Tax=Spongiivirga citrea TaxID=1481457 RepID=A0A6M0CIM4_9FLAO|nr:haloacid dehalogenase type II [Spongiivirga citrea]NER15814.1 haloacid dehalogenase type II [Spongiivirga citrea]
MKYTIAFDVYGTLINTSGVYDTLKNMVGEKAFLFMETWRNKQLEYSFRRALMDRYVDFSVCTKEALDYTCIDLEIDLSSNNKNELMNVYKVLPAFDDVISTLEELKNQGHRLFAFSNGSKNAVATLLENANISSHFEGIVSVESLKTFKPNPKVYAYFNEVTKSEKRASWLISGNTFDVIGAVSYGMNTAWVQRKENTVFDPWEYEPSVTIKSLAELPKKLTVEA